MVRQAFRRSGRRNPGHRGRGTRAVPAAMLVAALAGCTPTAPSRDADVAVDLDIDVAATWATIRAAQADRIEALATFTSAGDATLRFTGEDGAPRTEQVDLRLWRVAPAQAAVRLSKVGSSFLLAGWNADRWWLLDESGESPVLSVRRLQAVDANGAAALLSPPTLLAMLGLLPWPETAPPSLRAVGPTPGGEPDSILFELDRIMWSTGDGDLVLPGRMRVEIRRLADGPVRVELLDDLGHSVAVASLERHQPVETRGRAPGGWPMLSHRMRVSQRDGDEVVVRFDRPLAGGEVSPRLFDLDAVRRRVPDALVEDLSGGGS